MTNSLKSVHLTDSKYCSFFYVASLAKREGTLYRATSKEEIARHMGITVEHMDKAYLVQQRKRLKVVQEMMRWDLSDATFKP